MDSLTQVVLGSATALVITRGKSPRKAVIWGAVIATLPDLDVLIRHDNPLESLVAHRTWTHSWIIQTLLAPLIAWLLQRFAPEWSYKKWLLLVWVALTTHSGLDTCTVFGTDLFWPVAEHTILGGSVFIIDPLYTIPLLIVFVMALWRPSSPKIFRNAMLALVLSSAYLIWGLLAKTLIHHQAVEDLAAQGIAHQQVLVHATPFNTLLWRILVVDGDHYYEAYRSVLDKDVALIFRQYPRQLGLLAGLEDSLSLRQLKHFNHDYFAVSQQDDKVIVTDLRMGAEPVYSFQFQIAEQTQNGVQGITPSMHHRASIPKNFFTQIWDRIINREDLPKPSLQD